MEEIPPRLRMPGSRAPVGGWPSQFAHRVVSSRARHLIRRVADLMNRQGEVLFRRELGISLGQFLVLSVVDAYPGPLS